MAGSALLFPTFLVLTLVHFDFQGGRGILVVQSSTVCLLFPYFSHRFSYVFFYVFFGNGELGYFEQRLFGSDGPFMDFSCDFVGCVSECRGGFFWAVTRGRGLQQGLRLVRFGLRLPRRRCLLRLLISAVRVKLISPWPFWFLNSRSASSSAITAVQSCLPAAISPMMSAALSMTVLVYSAFSFAITSIAVGMMMILFVACGMRFSGLAAGLSQFLSCVSQWPVPDPRYALRCWSCPSCGGGGSW